MTGNEERWTNPEHEKERLFQSLMERARRGSAQLEAQHLRVLSDLTPEQARRWKALWPRLPVTTRRRMTELMARLLEDDPRLSFFEAGKTALEDEDPEVRVQALRLLGVEDLEARTVVPLCIRHLWDEAPQVRAQAAQDLGRFVLQGMVDQMPFALLRKAVAALLYILHEESPTSEVWAEALKAVSYANPRGLKDFLEFAYFHGEIPLRCAALVAMGRTLDDAWRDFILADLEHPHPKVRAAAAEAAGFAEIREALDELLYLLQDVSEEVRVAAAWAVSELADEDEHAEILEQAWREAQSDAEAESLEAALQNLEFRLMRRDWNLLEMALKEEMDQPPQLDLSGPAGTNKEGSPGREEDSSEASFQASSNGNNGSST